MDEQAPNGPTVKMNLQNPHTMGELHFSGNYLYGSRPILSFSPHFATAPHLQAIKELLTHVFSVPKCARKPKPFIDHILGFPIADGKIRSAITSTKSPFQKLATPFQKLQATPTLSKILLQQKNLKERNLSEVTRRYHLLKSVLALSSQQLSILSRVSEGRSNMRTRNSRARTRYVLRSE